MSFLRIIILGSYLAGVAGLVLGVAVRVGVHLGGFSSRGAMGFSAACFLCSLATREVAALLEKPKEEDKARAAAA